MWIGLGGAAAFLRDTRGVDIASSSGVAIQKT